MKSGKKKGIKLERGEIGENWKPVQTQNAKRTPKTSLNKKWDGEK
jgi:hypothetical protein